MRNLIRIPYERHFTTMCLFFCFWRSACRPISLSLNTGFLSPRGCAPLTPGCILAPFQGALFRYRSIRAFGALFRPLGSIRAFGALFRYRSIRAFATLLPHSGQYAPLIALFRPLGSIRALCHPGVALRLPRAVFWRPFRALYSPIAKLSHLP